MIPSSAVDGDLATPWIEAAPGLPAPAAGRVVRDPGDGAAAALRRVPAEASEALLAEALETAPLALLVADARFDAVGRLIVRLSVLEAALGRPAGSVRLAPMVGTAAGVGELAALARLSKRLVALGLDRPALAASLGLEAADRASPPLAAARGTLVLAAAAAGLPAFERAADGPADGVAIALRPDQAGGSGRSMAKTLSTTVKSR